MTFEEATRQAALEFAELCIKKQRDYGHRNITDFGEYGILVRLNDKLQRLINLYKQGKQPDNESVDDTWDDIGGYALIRKMMQRGWFELPLEGSWDDLRHKADAGELPDVIFEPVPLPSGGDRPKGAKPKITPKLNREIQPDPRLVSYLTEPADPEDATYG